MIKIESLSIWFCSTFRRISVNKFDLYITISRNNLFQILWFLRSNTHFRMIQLIDIICSDHISNQNRFHLVYILNSVKFNKRIFIKITTSEEKSIPSITTLFCVSNWFEREIWEMFGIIFVGHKDLRKLLTDYGTLGFPLRKDYPLTGYLEIYYNENNKRVISKI